LLFLVIAYDYDSYPDNFTCGFAGTGMVIPIFIDSVMDGLLIGITCSINIHAGLILSFANCVEMSLLGMALSSRIVKCTGSSLFWRQVTIVTPPLLLVAASVLGTTAGDVASQNPLLFVTFVSFGIVALLFLVCNELLIEARQSQNGDNLWYISIHVYLGVFVVLVTDALMAD